MEYKRHLDSTNLHNLAIRRAVKMELVLAIPETQINSEEVTAAQQKCASGFQGLERKLEELWGRMHYGDFKPVLRMEEG